MSVSVKIDALPLYNYRNMPVATLERTTHRYVAKEPYQYAGAYSCLLDLWLNFSLVLTLPQ